MAHIIHNQHVYVVRHRHTNAFMTTRLADKDGHGIVGFQSRRHAYTLKKLMNHQVKVEQFNTNTLVRLCHHGCLDFVCYHKSGHYTVYAKPDKDDIDQFRFLLETSFRFY